MADARKDPKPDPYIHESSRIREPRRMETGATAKSVAPEGHMVAKMTNNAIVQTIANNTITTTQYDTVSFDSHGLIDLANFQFLLPTTGKVTGLWVIHGMVEWEHDTVGLKEVLVYQNNTIIADSSYRGSGDTNTITGEVLVYVRDPHYADTFRLRVRQVTGGNLDTHPQSVGNYFEIFTLW